MTLVLDHILVGAADLDAAVSDFSVAAGVAPGGGGAHPGFGTHNQLLSLGENIFLEIIAPDPAQTETGRRVSSLSGLKAPRLHTYCLRTDDIAAAAERAASAGLIVTEPVAMSRTRPDGVRLEWEILYFDAPDWGETLPFLIDWKASPHPAASAPGGAALSEFTVLHPRAPELAGLHDLLGIEVPVALSPWPGFLARLESPKGEVVLT